MQRAPEAVQRKLWMSEQRANEEILSLLESVEVAVVATSAGDRVRCRMMHYAYDKNFNTYLATMKGDPKTVQITHHPSMALPGAGSEHEVLFCDGRSCRDPMSMLG